MGSSNSIQDPSSGNSFQIGIAVPGLRVRPNQLRNGMAGGQVNGFTRTSHGSGYTPYAIGTITGTGCLRSPSAYYAVGSTGTVTVFNIIDGCM